MMYLCFANGRNRNEVIKIFEGESYEIDRLTSRFIDSNEIRRKYKKAFAEFQKKYPQAGNGSVRIYGDSVVSENGQRVLYKKHKVAFNYITQDEKFLRWLGRNELEIPYNQRLIKDNYILYGIANRNRELIRIKEFLADIKRYDREDTCLTGGGKRYYYFLRCLLNRYEEYRALYDKPTLDAIWNQHLKKLEADKIKLQKEPLEHTLTQEEFDMAIRHHYSKLDEEREIDPDRVYYDLPAVYADDVYDFFQYAEFEKDYFDVFSDEIVTIVCDSFRTKDYSKTTVFERLLDRFFYGMFVSVNMPEFEKLEHSIFDSSKFVVVYGEEDNVKLRTLIIRAIENKSTVIFISDSPMLLDLYTEEFKSIVPILDHDKNLMKKQFMEFFVEQYKNAKGYKKQ